MTQTVAMNLLLLGALEEQAPESVLADFLAVESKARSVDATDVWPEALNTDVGR